MKKSINLFALVAVVAAGMFMLGSEVKARTTGTLYGDALIIGYPGTTVASISDAGVLTLTGQIALQSASSTTMSTLAASAAGATMYSSTYQTICVATGTAAGSWVLNASTSALHTLVACD